MNLVQRLKRITKNVQIRHYHSNVSTENSKTVRAITTARPSVMQQAFNKAIEH